MPSDPGTPTFLYDDLPLHWQMTRWEKLAFGALLQEAAPEVAIEIGTYKGGSLQVLSASAGKVYTHDISTECHEALAGRFDNVELVTGPSSETLPQTLQRIEAAGERLGFVLIDGAHSTEGVRGDINLLLAHKPNRKLYVVCHDSFNPECREGMLTAAWRDCPYVHFVDLDFVPGVYHYDAFDTAPARSMYGGFCLAVLEPEPRADELTIGESQRGAFDTVKAASRHRGHGKTRLERLIQRARRTLAGLPD